MEIVTPIFASFVSVFAGRNIFNLSIFIQIYIGSCLIKFLEFLFLRLWLITIYRFVYFYLTVYINSYIVQLITFPIFVFPSVSVLANGDSSFNLFISISLRISSYIDWLVPRFLSLRSLPFSPAKICRSIPCPMIHFSAAIDTTTLSLIMHWKEGEIRRIFCARRCSKI